MADTILDLPVENLLAGIDLEGSRKPLQSRDESRHAVRLFYSYAHEDEEFRSQLETHLKLLHRLGLIETWHDRDIGAGDDWRQHIDTNLERADVIMLLVSPDFMASDYCYDTEMSRAVKRQSEGKATVIPIIIRDVRWTAAPIGQLQALPRNGQAVKLWEDRDTAW